MSIFRHHNQRVWRRLGALSLCGLYGCLLLLMVFCFASGSISHHQAHHHARVHHHATAHSTAPPSEHGSHTKSELPDACGCTLRLLTSTMMTVVSLPSLGLPLGEWLPPAPVRYLIATPVLPARIRAPPTPFC